MDLTHINNISEDSHCNAVEVEQGELCGRFKEI